MSEVKEFEVISSMIDEFMHDEENQLYMVSATRRMGIDMVELIHEVVGKVEKILKYYVDNISKLDDMEIEVLNMKVYEMTTLLHSKMSQGERS